MISNIPEEPDGSIAKAAQEIINKRTKKITNLGQTALDSFAAAPMTGDRERLYIGCRLCYHQRMKPIKLVVEIEAGADFEISRCSDCKNPMEILIGPDYKGYFYFE